LQAIKSALPLKGEKKDWWLNKVFLRFVGKP
jgi:hypothetical protein